MNNTYRDIIIAQGLDPADYADCDAWTLSMLFDSWDEDDEI
jgi:hypothetical protein